MKILIRNVGPLTNYEVLEALRSRPARPDSESKILKYLQRTAAKNQTRKMVQDCAKAFESFDLSVAEVLNTINLRPRSEVEIYTMIEECESRMGDRIGEVLETISSILPDPSSNGVEEDS